MANALKKTNAYKDLKRGLEDNLTSRGLIEPQYKDMMEHYLELWIQFQELKKDIRDRGVTVWDEKRLMLVENRSVVLEMQVSRQMLNVYTALGFKDISCTGGKAAGFDDEL